MLSSVASFTLEGGEAHAVRVEVDVHRGPPSFSIVGMPDAAVREERERLRVALPSCGFEFPLRRIAVNLVPVRVRKSGPGLGLAIAAGVLCASGQVEPFGRPALVGELELSGELKPLEGIAVLAEAARAEGSEAIVVPTGQGAEAHRVRGIAVFEIERLSELAALAAGALSEVRPCSRNNAPGVSSRVWTAATVVAALKAWEERYGRPPTSVDWRNAGHDPRHPGHTTVYKLFGRWQKALSAAGMTPAPRRPRKPSERKKILARRLRQIADEVEG